MTTRMKMMRMMKMTHFNQSNKLTIIMCDK